MNVQPGAQLGPYRIVEKIGAGGMGEVYRATDTRLDRTVAVKVLLASVVADPERLRRFEQEAKTLAALNHPNILAVHDLGTQDGVAYLVSEFLDGDTLRECLDRGPMPVRKAVECALGVAHGLAAGHSKGIVHRDIKPENIFLTGDGRIKILDFGLAKLVQPAGGLSDTLLTGNATQPGVVLGTAGYMSPEQVRGEPAEATSDIFSFGAVLYEMLSGRRAFKRDTAAETMTAVLREDPPELAETEFHGPAGLQRILQRCLEKNPRQRFQSASDLGFAIESLSGSSGSSIASSASGIASGPVALSGAGAIRSGWRFVWALVPLAVIAAGLAAAWGFGHRGTVPALPTFKQLTFQRGYIPNARFTHDGQTVLYGGAFDDDTMTMFSIRTNLLQPEPISVPSAMLYAVSAADQMAIGLDVKTGGHSQTGTLAEVPVSGGTPRPIQSRVLSADYMPDGKTLALTRYTAGKCVLEFPAGKKVYESSGYLDHLRVSPDGKLVAMDEHLVPSDDRGLIAIVDQAGKETRLTPEYAEAQGVAWRSNSEIWFTAESGASSDTIKLYGVTLDGKVRTLLSAPVQLRLMDVTSEGRVLLDTPDERFSVSAMDTDGKVHQHLELYNGSIPMDISPDGKEFVMEEFGGTADALYLTVYRKTDGSPPLLLGKGAAAALSPDGKTVAALLYNTPPQLVIYPLGIGDSRTLALGDLTSARQVYWFADGKRLLVGGAQAGKGFRYWSVALDTGKVEPWGPDRFYVAVQSPDGKRIAGYMGQGAVLYDEATQQTTPIAGISGSEEIAGWSTDGQALLVATQENAGATLSRLDLKAGKRTTIRRAESPDKSGAVFSRLLVAQDGKEYVFWQAATHSTLWLVDGIQ